MVYFWGCYTIFRKRQNIFHSMESVFGFSICLASITVSLELSIDRQKKTMQTKSYSNVKSKE